MAEVAEIVLTAETGRSTGSSASRRLRAEGKVPAVLYGAGVESQALSVAWRDLRAALTTDKGLNAVITLRVDGDDHLTIVKDLQRHPVRRDVLHVDFLAVRRDQAVTAEVPIVLVGEPTKVLQERGVVDQTLHALTVQAKPDAIPGSLELDVSELEVGMTLHVSDLSLPPGVATEVEGDDPIATAQVARAVEAEAEAAEADDGEEGAAEGEAAEGGEAEGGDEESGE
jgi:large subunit ribosomal protein L25